MALKLVVMQQPLPGDHLACSTEIALMYYKMPMDRQLNLIQFRQALIIQVLDRSMPIFMT